MFDPAVYMAVAGGLDPDSPRPPSEPGRLPGAPGAKRIPRKRTVRLLRAAHRKPASKGPGGTATVRTSYTLPAQTLHTIDEVADLEGLTKTKALSLLVKLGALAYEKIYQGRPQAEDILTQVAKELIPQHDNRTAQ